MRGSQNLTILATSREALGTDGERVWRIPSMSAESGEARDLFLARAAAASSDFEVDSVGVELVERICAQLDGIPLAIELAAARVGHLSLSELEAGLDERFALLSGGRRARRQRQQTLQAMMDWSWDLLDADERTMLTELSVFRGGFDSTGVEVMCSRPETGTWFDVLTGLVDRSLVQVAAESGAMSRYQLLETVRLYGLDRLAAAGTTSEVRDHHAQWVRAGHSCLVTAAEVGSDPDAALYWMRNTDNMLATAEWFAESGDFVAAAEVVSGRSTSFSEDHNVDGIRWFTKAFVEDPRLPDDVALAVSFTAAMVVLDSGDYLAGASFVRTGLDRLDQLDSGTGLSDVARWWGTLLCGIAAIQTISTDRERARSLLACATVLRGGWDWPTGTAGFAAGLLAQADSDFETAVELTTIEATDPAWRALPGHSSRCIVHAASLSSLGRHEEAVAAARQIPSDVMLRKPNSTFAVRVAWVLVRAGLTQEALDLIAKPTRLALGVAIEQWRFGRSLVLAEYVFDRDPNLAARTPRLRVGAGHTDARATA